MQICVARENTEDLKNREVESKGRGETMWKASELGNGREKNEKPGIGDKERKCGENRY